jgi:site-specific DNA recombinase
LVSTLKDGEGRAMTPSHATRPGVRYRYYVAPPDLVGGSPAWRVPAHDLETLVCEQIARLLLDQRRIAALITQGDNHAQVLQRAIARGEAAATTLRSVAVHARADLLAMLSPAVRLTEAAMTLLIDPAKLAGALGADPQLDPSADTIALACPATRVRRGHQLRLVIPGMEQPATPPATRDEKLVGLIAEAHAARQLVLAHPGKSMAGIAAQEQRCRTRMAQLVALSCLAPDIVTMIVEGRQPATMTARTLLNTDLPARWDEQRKTLGLT